MEAINRYIPFNDWITFICLIALIILVIAKKTSPYHFKNFLLLIVSDKHIKTHKEDTSKKRLHYSLLLFQGLIISLLLHFSITQYYDLDSYNWLLYALTLASYTLFYFIKFISEKGAGIITGNNTQVSSYLFQKQTYFNYLALCIYPFLILFIYFLDFEYPIYILLFISAFSLIISVSLSIANHRALFYSKPYYFILYICTFEIAPYALSFLMIPKVI